jgi:hypothetical protein
MGVKWILPHKPNDMNLTTWAALLARSGGACEIRCSTQCDTRLEVDHRHSRGLDGETSLANCRLICGKANRERGMANDPKWEINGYFDEAFNYDALRKTQKFNLDSISECVDLFVGQHRSKLLGSVSLYPLTCGAGKTVLMLAVLFLICKEVTRLQPANPRPRKILWFVHQSELCRQTKHDLIKDIIDLRLVSTLPEIRICDETGDIDTDPRHHDITISCPHALWGTKTQRRSDVEIERILSYYDVIIWDECDFARDQIARLVRLAPHALKFGLTAAPIDADGNFIKECFILAGSASHAMVFEHDKCLAPMLPWLSAIRREYIKPVKHHGYGKFAAGIEQLAETGEHGEKFSLPGSMAAIRSAIHDSNALEQQMKEAWAQHWFSPHIFVPCNTIDEAIELCNQTRRDLALGGFSQDHGWYPTILVSAETKRDAKIFEKGRPKVELKMFHNNDEDVHPFRRALFSHGRCGPGSSRICFVVDMLLRGLNHWAIKYLVDIKRSRSWSEQLQTIGRTSRLPKHLIEMLGDDKFDAFCHPRFYFPDHGPKDVSSAKDAWEFILHMDERLEESGLISWRELLDGRNIEQSSKTEDAAAPFTAMDQLQIDNSLGEITARGEEITPEHIDAIVRALPDPQSESRVEFAKDHIRRVLTDRDYRNKIIMPEFDIIRPISREAPKRPEDYLKEELRAFILAHSMIPNEFADRLDDPNIEQLVGIMKRDDDAKHYRQVTKIRQLHEADGKPGVVTDIRNSLVGELVSRGYEYGRIIGPTSAETNSAIVKICGVQNVLGATANDGILDRPQYHYQFSLPNIRKKIKQIALGQLIMRGILGPAVHLYGSTSSAAVNVKT